MLYTSYTFASSISRSPQGRHGSFVDKEHLETQGKEVSAKLRQHHVLERIKAKAIEEK
jgi:hypothetical protein